jgi:hypothetical protein
LVNQSILKLVVAFPIHVEVLTHKESYQAGPLAKVGVIEMRAGDYKGYDRDKHRQNEQTIVIDDITLGE